MQQPKEEYGWVLIDAPEKRQEMGTIRVGDQTWIHPGVWTSCRDTGAKPWPGIYRRPVDVGDGWELVPVGAKTDERTEIFNSSTKRWHPESPHNFGHRIGEDWWPRRRKKPEAKAQSANCERPWVTINSSGPIWYQTEAEANDGARLSCRDASPCYVFRAVRRFESKTEILETEL